MTLNRAEESMTRQALGKPQETADKRREARLSEAMGQEERFRVESAITQALQAQAESQSQIEFAVAAERARCLAICAQWPDNLMAKHLAALIRGGK